MYEIFEKLLEAKSISIYKFCKDTGVAESTIYTWKKKKNQCSAKLQKIICDYFGVTVDYLMTGEESKSQNNYYLDPETAITAQEIFENDHVLFDVYRSCDKDRLIEYAKRLKELRDMENGGI